MRRQETIVAEFELVLYFESGNVSWKGAAHIDPGVVEVCGRSLMNDFASLTGTRLRLADHQDRADPTRRPARARVQGQLLLDDASRARSSPAVHTADGLVGTAYAADEEHTVLRDHEGRRERDRPPPDRSERAGDRALLGARVSRYVRPAARPPHRPGGAGRRRPRALGPVRPGRRTARSGELWGGYRDRLPVNIIGGYYGRDSTRSATRSPSGSRWASAAASSSSARSPPESTPSACRMCRETAGDDFVITIDANQGYTLRDGARRSATGSASSISAGSRSRAAGPTTPATCARCVRAAASRCAPARASTRRRAAAT